MNQTNKYQFKKLFNKLSANRSAGSVWEDLIYCMASSLSNMCEFREEVRKEREELYEASAKRLGNLEIVSELFAIAMTELRENPNQDFLGEMYAILGLNKSGIGQVFTPYHVAHMMASSTLGSKEELTELITKQGYISITDPTCGAGVMLIAAANRLKELEVDYSKNVVFAAQDIDNTAALMCYIQLSILGCAAYIKVGNTLADPLTGLSALLPDHADNHNFWFTPQFLSPHWIQMKFNELKRNVKPVQTEIGKKRIG